MALGSATMTATKRNWECIHGETSEPQWIKRRKRSNKISKGNHQRMRPHVGILPKLLSLGVNCPTWILHKTLHATDHSDQECRLLLTKKMVHPSPLFQMLSKTEQEAVFHPDGLKVRAFDRLGREYFMKFKFLQSNKAYRLIGDWIQFLRKNSDELSAGDDIEIWGFRIMREEGRSELGMALLHYAKEGHEKGKKEKVLEENGDKRKREKCMKKYGVTEDEWMVVLALLELKRN